MTEETPKNTASQDVPRFLCAYGEGEPLPPVRTEAERAEFEAEQRRGWEERSN